MEDINQTRVEEDEGLQSSLMFLRKLSLIRSPDGNYANTFSAILMFAIIPLYIAKLNSKSTLTMAIVVCLSYLIHDYFITPEFEEKCVVLMRKFIQKLFKKQVYKRWKAYNEMLHQNEVIMRRNDLLVRQKDVLVDQVKDLLKKLKKAEEEKTTILKEILDNNDREENNEPRINVEDFNYLLQSVRHDRDIEKKREELFEEVLNRLERENKDKESVSQLEDKCEILKKSLESERLAYRNWRDREQTLKTVVEDGNRNLERKLEEATKEAKDLREEMNDVRDDFDDGRVNYFNSIENRLDELNAIIVQNSDETEQENCKKLEEDRNAMLKMMSNLEEERDELVKQNKEFHNLVTRSLTEGLEEKFKGVADKFKGVTDLLTEHIINNDQISKKVLENQDTLIKLLQDDTSSDESDDGFEVVEEN